MEHIVKSRDGNILERNLPRAEEALENTKEKGSEYWKMTKEKGQRLWNDTDSTRRQALGQIKGFIQKHPGQAVGYAVLLGVIVGAVFYPRGRD